MAGPTNTQFAVAVHVLTLLGGSRECSVSSEQMSASVGANPVYLRRVLGQLGAAGLVRSRPSARGGWQLAHEPAQISLGDAWRAIQTGKAVFGLHDVDPNCDVADQVARSLGTVDARLAVAIERELDHTSIAEIVPVAAVAAPPVPTR